MEILSSKMILTKSNNEEEIQKLRIGHNMQQKKKE